MDILNIVEEIKIPKIIHQIWIGPLEKPEAIKTWQNITILPSYTFYPEDSKGTRYDGYENAIASHYWGSTKKIYKSRIK